MRHQTFSHAASRSRFARFFPIASIGALLTGGAFAQTPLIYNRSVYNAASYMPAGIPAGAIAQGSIFSRLWKLHGAGRLGCTLAHDHRGLASTSWIAVKFPEGPRYDLGLIEFLFLIGMTIAFRVLDRHARPVGFFFGLYGVVYGGFRIWLDTLHVQPMRFYGGMAGVAVGVLGWMAMLALERSRAAEIESAPALG